MFVQRRKWLSNAIEAMQGADPVKLMLQDIQTLINKDSDVECKECALEDLQQHTEDIDLANGMFAGHGYESNSEMTTALLTNCDYDNTLRCFTCIVAFMAAWTQHDLVRHVCVCVFDKVASTDKF